MSLLSLQSTPFSSFRLDKFIRNEDAVRVATSLFVLLAKDFKMDKENLFSDSPSSINLALLRQQQQRLSLVKAVKVFFAHHLTLRHILKQVVSNFKSRKVVRYHKKENLQITTGSSQLDSSSVTGAEQDAENVSVNSAGKDILLVQKLLVKATHPSPLKSMFGIDELESAALAISQFLSSACAAQKTNLGSPTQEEMACPDLGKLSNDLTCDGAGVTIRTHTLTDQSAVGQAVTSRDLRRSRRSRPKVRPPSPPMTATVRQLVEMGFSKSAVERASKAIEGVNEMGPSAESIVAWILEHPDESHKPPSPQESMAELEEECSESDTFSDSFEDIDASGTSDRAPLGNAAPIFVLPHAVELFKKRRDFASNDDYAVYVMETIQAGMTVRCCRTYEEVHEGDIGKVVKLDRDGLHDLNVQVDWQRKGGTYWVRYIHVELLSNPSSGLGTDYPGVIKPGDRVRVKESVTNPAFKVLNFHFIGSLAIHLILLLSVGKCQPRSCRSGDPHHSEWKARASRFSPTKLLDWTHVRDGVGAHVSSRGDL